jgi:hypothetical protein
MNRIASYDLEALLEVVNLIVERNKYPYLPTGYTGTKKKYVYNTIMDSMKTLLLDNKNDVGACTSTLGYSVRITDIFEPSIINYKGNQIVAFEVHYTGCSDDMNFVYFDGTNVWKDIEDELEGELNDGL